MRRKELLMRFSFYFLCILVVFLIFNLIYSFLPQKVQNITWVRVCAIIAAIIILIYGVYQVVHSYRSYRFAYISKDGAILRRKNFPWEVTKITNSDGDIVYVIKGRYGDSSEISIVPDQPAEAEVYNSADGIGVKFQCPEKEIPNFKIEIRK